MKKKNLALRMSACMMSALLVVGSAAPAYAVEDMVFADQAEDVQSDEADPVAGDGAAYIQDSTWTFGEQDADGNAVDGQALLENTIRTAQYAITKNTDGSFSVAGTDFGKNMRAFEALDASAYTKASYKAAKDL